MSEANITTQEDFEREYKQKLFARIDLLCSSQRNLIAKIKNAEEYLDANVAGELPNIGITFNNKIVELMHLFQDAGISMFSQSFKNYGSKKLNFISSSFIGDSIIFYMLDKIEESIKSLLKYETKLNSLIDLEREKCNAFYTANPIKKFSLMARSLVSVPPELDFSCTLEDSHELNCYASNYIEIDDELWKISLKELSVPSLVTHIKRTKQTEETIPGLLNDAIIPYLEKLGLSDLVPELQKEISKSFEQAKDYNSEDAR